MKERAMPNQINASILEFLRAKGPHLDLAIGFLRRPDLLQCNPVRQWRRDRRHQLPPLVLYATACARTQARRQENCGQ